MQVGGRVFDDPQVMIPIEIREMTRLESSKGDIHIIHEITLGDMIISTLLILILMLMLISKVTRR